MLNLIETVHLNQSWNLELQRRERFISERRGNVTLLVMSVVGKERPDIFEETIGNGGNPILKHVATLGHN